MKKRVYLLLLCAALCLIGCQKKEIADETPTENEQTNETETTETDTAETEDGTYVPRHYITRPMIQKEAMLSIHKNEVEDAVEFLEAAETLTARYPADRVFEPAGKVEVDGMMYVFGYVNSKMTDQNGEPVDAVIAQFLLSTDLSEMYECWWLSEELLIYDSEDLLHPDEA